MAKAIRHYLLSILLLTGIVIPNARGQEQTFTLEDCIRFAQENSTKVHLSKADEEIARADYKDAIGRLLPEVSVGTSAHINYGRGIDPKTNTYTNVSSFRNNYDIESSLLIFDGLSSIYNIKDQQHERKARREDYRKTQHEVRMNTIEAYYNLLYAKELKRLSEEHYANSDRLSRQAEKMLELGMKAPRDAAEMKAAAAKDKVNLIQRTNQYEIALLQLKAVMNYPISKPLLISDSLTYDDVHPTPLRVDELFGAALSGLPEARIADHRLESSKAKYRSSIGAFMPKISLFAGINTGYFFYMDGSAHESFAEQFKNKRGSYIGISMTIDIFSGLRKINQLSRTKARYLGEQYRHSDVQQQIYKDIQEAILNLNASVEEYKATVEEAGYLSQVYEAGLKNYHTGNISSLDLSIASARSQEAQCEVARKYTLYLLYKERLAYYTH